MYCMAAHVPAIKAPGLIIVAQIWAVRRENAGEDEAITRSTTNKIISAGCEIHVKQGEEKGHGASTNEREARICMHASQE